MRRGGRSQKTRTTAAVACGQSLTRVTLTEGRTCCRRTQTSEEAKLISVRLCSVPDTVPSSQPGPRRDSCQVSDSRPLPPPSESPLPATGPSRSHRGLCSVPWRPTRLRSTCLLPRSSLRRNSRPPFQPPSPLSSTPLAPDSRGQTERSRTLGSSHGSSLPLSRCHSPELLVWGPAKPLRYPPQTCLCSQHLSLSGMSQPVSLSTCSLHWKLICLVHRGAPHGPIERTQ